MDHDAGLEENERGVWTDERARRKRAMDGRIRRLPVGRKRRYDPSEAEGFAGDLSSSDQPSFTGCGRREEGLPSEYHSDQSSEEIDPAPSYRSRSPSLCPPAYPHPARLSLTIDTDLAKYSSNNKNVRRKVQRQRSGEWYGHYADGTSLLVERRNSEGGVSTYGGSGSRRGWSRGPRLMLVVGVLVVICVVAAVMAVRMSDTS